MAATNPTDVAADTARRATKQLVAGLPPAPAAWCSGLRKRYGRQQAVDDVSLEVGRGQVVGLLGPNGAGKTSVIKMLLGLVHPDAGEVLLLGRPAADPAARARVGYLPELFRYQPWLSAAEVLALHVRLSGIEVSAQEQRECLALVGLAERAADRLGNFSKGMQQRLGLAVALVARPEFVVLDEPTSALDPLGRVDAEVPRCTASSAHLTRFSELSARRTPAGDSRHIATRLVDAGESPDRFLRVKRDGILGIRAAAGNIGCRRRALYSEALDSLAVHEPVALVAGAVVATGAAVHEVVAVSIPRVERVPAPTAEETVRVAGRGVPEEIITRAAEERVVVEDPVHGIVARSALDPVVARSARQRGQRVDERGELARAVVVAGAADHQIAAAAAIYAVPARTAESNVAAAAREGDVELDVVVATLPEDPFGLVGGHDGVPGVGALTPAAVTVDDVGDHVVAPGLRLRPVLRE
jgi:ABC-type branched-subunit amino acid transport system ATPase component